MTNYGYFPYHLYKPDYSKLSNILLRGDSKDYDWYGLRKSFSSSLQQSLFRESLLKLDYASLERRVAEHFAPKSIHVMSRPVEITDTETFTVTLDFSMPIHDEIVIELPPAPKPAKTFNFIVFDRDAESRREIQIPPELQLCSCDSLTLFRQGCRCGGH